MYMIIGGKQEMVGLIWKYAGDENWTQDVWIKRGADKINSKNVETEYWTQDHEVNRSASKNKFTK